MVIAACVVMLFGCFLGAGRWLKYVCRRCHLNAAVKHHCGFYPLKCVCFFFSLYFPINLGGALEGERLSLNGFGFLLHQSDSEWRPQPAVPPPPLAAVKTAGASLRSSLRPLVKLPGH